MSTNQSSGIDLNELSIAELRQQAKALKIDTSRDWDKDMFVAALDARRKSRAICRIVTDEDSPIAPGFSRILIFKGPTGSDNPVPIQLNRFKTTLPRDTIIDVPTEILGNLDNSHDVGTEETLTADGRNVTSLKQIKSYPYQKIGSTKGDSGLVKGANPPQTQSLRQKFRDLFGRWPNSVQFRSFKDNHMARIAAEHISPEDISMAFEASNAKKPVATS